MTTTLNVLSFCAAIVVAGTAGAAELSLAANTTGKNVHFIREQLDIFEKQTGHKVSLVTMPPSSSEQFSQYRLWLAAGNKDVDVYQTDVVWAPQLADQFVDLTEAAKDVVGQHFPSIIASQTVNGRLVALPVFTDAPALFYRKDLLEKYGKTPPKTWDELAATAKEIQEKERAAGQADLWGYVFQGNAYEGLTALIPPKEKRGLVLIDPPYEEERDDYAPVVDLLQKIAVDATHRAAMKTTSPAM